MNKMTKDVTTNSRLLKKRTLATAVATAVFGAGVASAADMILHSSTTIGSIGSNATTDYIINQNATLTTNGTMSVYYGTIDGTKGRGTWSGGYGSGNSSRGGQVIIGGNLTIHGNVGATNATSNFTVVGGNTLTLSNNVSSFTSDNFTLNAGATLNLGNSSNVNRSSTLTFSTNITMSSGSIINVGNGTTFGYGNSTSTGVAIRGASDGVGTLNIHGNVTSGGVIGGSEKSKVEAQDLATVTVTKGNTFTLAHESSVTNYYINGTLTNAVGLTGNMTGNVKMGASGILNLYNRNDGATQESTTARVVGRIDGASDGVGTLNINGTYTTGGQIGRDYKLAAINLSNATLSNGFTTTFAHSVNATTIKVGTASTQGNATLAIKEGGKYIVITGNIVGGGNSTATDNAAGGRFYVRGNATVDGNIGSSSARLADIRIEDGTTLSIIGASRNIYANNITLMDPTDSATLTFNGTGTTTVYGIIAGETTEGDGTVDVNTGIVYFKNTLGTHTNNIRFVDVADGSTITTMSNIYANQTIKIRGTLNIDGTGGITIVANDGAGDGGGLQIGSNTDNGTLETAGTVTLSSNTTTSVHTPTLHSFNNATIKLNGTHSSHATSATAYVDIGSNNQSLVIQGHTTINLDLTNTVITDGATIVIVGRSSDSGNNGTLNVSGNITATAYQMFNITFNNSTAFSSGYATDKNNAALNATVSYRSSSSLGLTGNDKTVYDASKVAIAADTAVFQALAGMSTDATLKAALTTMSPATAGAAGASAAISGSSVSTANTRMAYMRQTGLGKGMNAGGAAKDESIWLQIFGANIDQDTVSSVSGYDADGQGIAIGIDGLSEDGTTRIGVAGSFAKTDVNGKDSTTKTINDIDTTQVMVYANKDYPDGMYLQGVASYSFNDNTGTRRILVGAVDRTASSVYESGLFSINVEAGWPKEDDGVTITPTVGLTFSSLSSDAYTETGAGNMNLSVTPTDVTTMEGKVGVKVTGKTVDSDGGIGRPEFRFGVVSNFGDDTADSTATFTAGGSSFTTTGVKTDSTKVDVGLGYTYTTPEGDTEISVNADGRHSSSYLQFGGGLTVKWKF